MAGDQQHQRAVAAEKLRLRQHYKKQRALSAPFHLHSEKLCTVLKDWLAAQDGVQQIFAYWPLEQELSLVELFSQVDASIRIALPRVRSDGVMSFHQWRQGDVLLAGPFGLQQPSAEALELQLDRASVMLLPGLAFDAAGTRLGYGGGYYDRYLQNQSPRWLVGVCLDAALCQEKLPREDWDVLVDHVATPSQVLRCRI